MNRTKLIVGYIGIGLIERRRAGELTSSSFYLGSIRKVSLRDSEAFFNGWLGLDGLSYEASGIVTLKKVGLFGWKITQMRSDFEAFGEAFFDGGISRE